ncbi:T4 beta protein [Rhizobium sp. PP-F2F-G38]|nr:T4 beta protein [Rhizobium sp. PP-F2F-G38]
MPFAYRPMLKTKAGEAVALGQLSQHQKDRIFPIFQVGENPPPTFAHRLSTNWQGRGAALDGLYNYNFTGLTAGFDTVFNALVAAGIPAIPSIDIAAPAAYLQSASSKVGVAAPGLVLRTNLGSLSGALAFVGANGWSPAEVDLLIEVGHIAEFNPSTLAVYISAAINTQIVAGVWRSVTLSGSSAPKDFGGLTSGVNIIPRQEWILWHAISHPPGQQIDYSDFCVSHLDLAEPPGYAMARATVSVRYTALQHWVMIKGRATTGPNGLAMGDQYRSHAQALVARPEFNGVHPCWGDTRISGIANGTSSPGGRSQWVEINANRHLAFVAANLP